MAELSKKKKMGIAAAIPVLAVIIYIFREPFMGLSRFLGKCPFHTITGYHCPGCGNTRSLRALLDLNIPLALHNNPAMPTLALICVLGYIELIFDICGKKVHILPRSIVFWYTVLGLFCVFYIVRNFVPALQPVPQ